MTFPPASDAALGRRAVPAVSVRAESGPAVAARARRWLALLGAALALGCAEVIVGPDGGGRVARAVRLDAASVTVDEGADARLTATVLDQRQEPIPPGELPEGTAVEWASADAGVASVAAGGVVLAHRPGVARVTATLVNTIGRPSVSAEVVVRARVAGLTAAGGDAQTRAAGEALGAPVAVRVTGVSGAPVAGVPVAFAVAEGGGSVPDGPALTDAEGIARAAWTLGTRAGPQALVATTERLPGAALRLTATAVAGAPARVAVAGGSGQTAPPDEALAAPLVARVTDRYDNPVPGVAVAWAPNAGQGRVAEPSGVTDADGRASAAWTLGTEAGPMVATATVEGLPPALFDATATAGGPARVRVTPAAARAGAFGRTIPFAAEALDRFGNAIPGVEFEWEVDDRVAGVDARGGVDVRGNGTAEVRARVKGGGAVGTAHLTVEQVPAAVRLTAPGSRVVAGGRLAVAAAVVDSGGAPVEAPYAVTWRSSAPAVAAVNDAGVVTGVAAGEAVITAAVGEASAAFAVTVDEAPRYRLAVVEGGRLAGPAEVFRGAVIVRLLDAAGRPVADRPLTWEPPSGGGRVDPLAARTDAEGRVGATWWFGPEQGRQTLRVVAPDVAGAPAVVVEGTAGLAPDAIEIASGDGQTIVEGYATPRPIVVRLTAHGVPVAGVPVEWARLPDDKGGIRVLDAATDADGRSAAAWAPNGATSLVAAVRSVSRGAYLQARPVAGLVPPVEVAGGQSQTGVAGEALGAPLALRVVDGEQRPLAGAVVAWSVATGGGSVAPVDGGRTDAEGVSRATWTLGAPLGGQRALATVTIDGEAGRVVRGREFVATAVAGGPAPSCRGTGGTVHTGDVNAGTTWTRADSPHRVKGLVRVQNGATLTIEPGALVCGSYRDFTTEAGRLQFRDGGRLEANGTAARPITFEGDKPYVYLFHAIEFLGSPAAPSTLRHVAVNGVREAIVASPGHVVHVEDATFELSYTAVRLQSAGSRLTRVSITRAGVDTGGSSRPAVILSSGTAFVGGTVQRAYGTAISIAGADVLVDGVRVLGNAGSGERTGGIFVGLAPGGARTSGVTIRHADISGYLHQAVYVSDDAPDVVLTNNALLAEVRAEPGAAVDARDNWWGDPAGPNGPDGSGVTGPVRFDPWLTAPPARAGATLRARR